MFIACCGSVAGRDVFDVSATNTRFSAAVAGNGCVPVAARRSPTATGFSACAFAS